MALIACPECGKRVSDVAPACPACGFPVAGHLEQLKREEEARKEEEREERERIFREKEAVFYRWVLVVVLILIVIAVCIFGPMLFNALLHPMFTTPDYYLPTPTPHLTPTPHR